MFNISRNGKPLSKDKYSIDEVKKVFISEENGLILDFTGLNGWTFDTGSYCIFKTGSHCIFKTGCSCIFKTRQKCIFDTTDGCTFRTYGDCEFKTAFGCTFITSGKGDGSLFLEAEDLTFKWNIKQGNDVRDFGEYIPTHIESLTIEYSEFKELGGS